MPRYAKGKHAVLISDRSGWKIKYKDARTEWTGARVSKQEWEAKQPQLDPQKYLRADGTGGNVLYDPRPDDDSVPTNVRLGPLYGKWSGQAAANVGIPHISLFEDAAGFQVTAWLGTVKISIVAKVSGFGLTASQGTVKLSGTEDATGFELQALPTSPSVTIQGIEVPTGLAATAQQGTVQISGLEAVTGLSATAQQGTVTAYELVTVSINATALTMTAVQGTIGVTSPSWGNFTWGHDLWGQ